MCPAQLAPVLFSKRADVLLSIPPPSFKTLFLLGGRRPDSGWLNDFASRNSPEVWAVDSGVAACRAALLRPKAIIGDGDSALDEDWSWAIEEGADEFRHPKAKDLTDFQLALDLLTKKALGGFLLISGCFGGRLDHLFSIVNTSASYAPLCMIDDSEGLVFIRGGDEAKACFKTRPLAVSLLPLSSECRGVSISGVRWPLSGAELKRDFPWAVSNEMYADGDSFEASVRCKEGLLGFYWSF